MTKAVEAFAAEWAALTGASRIELVGPEDEARLTEEALSAGEVQPVFGHRYYARSYVKDTARSEERTFVSTSSERDRGVYNNWRFAADLKPRVMSLMEGASRGKTMYVIPYLMSNPGSPLAPWAAGVELTDSRLVVLHMLRMTRVGLSYLGGGGGFVKGVHVTGDLEHLGQGTPDDRRHFVTVADERLIIHFGSSYGGNALLAKIAHGLRQASYDGWRSGRFLAEQFMLIGVHDRLTGETSYIAGGFPSASGKTNLAMLVPPPPLDQRYEVQFLGDDIAWMYVDEADGRLYAMNPEYGVFGVAKDTNERTNPNAMRAIGPDTGTLFTNTAYNPATQDVWWEGKTEVPPRGGGWLDWRGQAIPEAPLGGRDGATQEEWSHPNSRFTTALKNVPNLSPRWQDPKGVPLDAIIFGGRVRRREPLVRAILDLADGVYDGLTLGAEATAAAEGKAGVLRYDPMSMRPFLSYGEGDYARHWLDVLGRARERPIFAHVNWFQRDESGAYLWPGYGENLRALLWLLDLKAGRVKGCETPVGVIPAPGELNLEGLDIPASRLERLLRYDPEEWRPEVESRREHLRQFERLPEEIWKAHERLAEAVGA
ncbi:MAG TPA: phosphoenolpyruvate carboxykinase (GTP) [Dehalococcoidia bacterium]|nr:phosphoenolpyruvate carboxykinase (GTP) [Dehalococcoidia bacterium]